MKNSVVRENLKVCPINTIFMIFIIFGKHMDRVSNYQTEELITTTKQEKYHQGDPRREQVADLILGREERSKIKYKLLSKFIKKKNVKNKIKNSYDYKYLYLYIYTQAKHFYIVHLNFFL